MPDNKLTETQTENLLEAITNAILAEQQDFDSIIRRYAVSEDDINDYVALIESINDNLTLHEPDDAFVTNLRNDLFGAPSQPALRQFPMRARLAAVFAAVLATVFWFVRRRSSDSGISKLLEEIPVH